MLIFARIGGRRGPSSAVARSPAALRIGRQRRPAPSALIPRFTVRLAGGTGPGDRNHLLGRHALVLRGEGKAVGDERAGGQLGDVDHSGSERPPLTDDLPLSADERVDGLAGPFSSSLRSVATSRKKLWVKVPTFGAR